MGPPPAPEVGSPLVEHDAPVPEKKAHLAPARLVSKKGTLVAASSTPAAPVSLSAKKQPPPAAAALKPAKGGTPASPSALNTFKYKHAPEDAEALAAELIPSNLITDLGDANWKTRLAALEEMTTWVEGIVEELDAEVVRALGKKGWGEKNFQVSAKLYGILVILADLLRSYPFLIRWRSWAML
jgi:cytoskeleton-associated protein 5